MSRNLRMSGLVVTEPDTSFSQRDVLAMLELDGDTFAERIFNRAAVATRSLDLPSATMARPLQGRTSETENQLLQYAIDGIGRLEVDPSEIGTVVSASLYSLGGPTLAQRLVDHFRMDPATDKYHVTGVGCASLVPLVRLASSSFDHQPGKKALIVAAECMSGLLTHATPEDERAKTIGSAIFGDGCGVAVIDEGTSGPAIVASRVHQIEGTLDVVRMELSDEDSYLHMDRELPDIAAEGLPGLVDDFLSSAAITRSDVDHWVVHPGGRRILDRVGEVMRLSREQLELSYEVLATRGNVGTPSIFYVLSETIKQRRPGSGDRALLVTVGPGVTVGLMLLAF